MKTPKLAVLLGTFFLISSLILPSLVAAESLQAASLEITGTRGIIYNNLGGDMPDMAFEAVTVNPLTPQSSQSINTNDAAPWDADYYVGLYDLGMNEEIYLTVDAPDVLTNIVDGSTKDLTGGNFGLLTTANKATGGSITLTDSSANNYTFLEDLNGSDAQDMFFWEPPGGGWDREVGDFVSATNVTAATDVTDAARYAADPVTAAVEIMATVPPALPRTTIINGGGITGIAYNINGIQYESTGSYQGNITYTLAVRI